MPLFRPEDLIQIEKRGLTPMHVEKQLNIFKEGNQFVHLDSASTPGHGIIVLSDEEQEKLVNKYEADVNQLDLIKFTPASGMASRMFKFLHFFKNTFDPNQQSLNAYLNRNKTYKLREFIAGMDKFPFYSEIDKRLQQRGVKKTPINRYRIEFVNQVINQYGDYPKGLVPFHNYRGEIITPFEEHINESLLYLKSHNTVKHHFTISPNSVNFVKKSIESFASKISNQHNISVQVEYSYQDSKTDTIAVDQKNNPIRDKEGQLVFRNGGHGSLLENLNTLDADLIFIKNIDNVAKRDWHEKRSFYKKVLAGKLLSVQELCFEWLRKIDAGTANRKDLESFVDQDLKLSHLLDSSNELFFDACKKALNRPIRVCGMVKNEGEVGGGPFWINKKGKKYLQIVESSQVNIKDKKQKEIFKSSSHFNPVDLVCGVKDYKGQKFDLTQFSDADSCFVTKKSMKGISIKALEHPGLWNGSMALWTTIFVEVPVFTFTPVKSSNELLRPAHQVF